MHMFILKYKVSSSWKAQSGNVAESLLDVDDTAFSAMHLLFLGRMFCGYRNGYRR